MGNYKENIQRLGVFVRDVKKSFGFENDIKWGTVTFMFVYHAWAIYWSYNYALPVKWQTVAFAVFMYIFNGIGLTAGVHRYWSHRSFKAARPLKILLLIMFASAGQTSVNRFVRNHRVHHKCTDTHGDPHNATRDWFFSHKNKEILERSRTIDYSDITSDPLLIWYKKHVIPVNVLLCFVVPSVVCGAWGERWPCAVAWQCCLRYLLVMHCGFSNSFTHRKILPAKNINISLTYMGEGFHNFHHTFPYDYRAGDRFFPVSIPTILHTDMCQGPS